MVDKVAGKLQVNRVARNAASAITRIAAAITLHAATMIVQAMPSDVATMAIVVKPTSLT